MNSESNNNDKCVNLDIFSIEDKTKLERKIKNLNRSKLRLKKKLNNRIVELQKKIDKLEWDDNWDDLDDKIKEKSE